MTTETLLPDPSLSLEQAFSAVAQRMQGLGFVNPALRVQAVGFEPWKGFWLGVMVTPWSVNLMLLPRDPAAWHPVRAGEKRSYEFPAGHYDFIGAVDSLVGEYRMCSLFSPALEFEDHAAAALVAKLARAALFDATNAASDQAPVSGDSAPERLAKLDERATAPLSKRDFLRGRFLRADKPDVPGR